MEEQGIAVVVEDDTGIRDSLREVLQQSGFAVHATSTGAAGVEAVRRHNPTVVTVDLALPDFDGIEASRRIRTFSDAYLIVMGRVDEVDALLSFEAGADDYLTTPFRPRELRARIAAMLRRPRRFQPSMPVAPEPLPADPLPVGRFEHNGLVMDEVQRTASIDGRAVNLTRTQFDLLLAIMESGPLIQTRADLVRRVRNETAAASYVSPADEHAIEVHMGNLRKRLADDFRAPRWVETVRGIGYRLGRAR
jgi:DNA-binding response OmpR family regulator